MKSTQSAHNQLTELFCFIWPTIQSYKLYKSEIISYNKIISDLTQEELNSVFASDFEFNKIDFKKSVIKPTYEDYIEKFANILLTNLFAIYEGWLAETCDKLGFIGRRYNHKDIKYEKTFQFPSYGHNFGINETLNELTPSYISEMDVAFGNILRANDKYSLNEINNQLICYRVFKEIRNTIIHGNGVCGQKLIDVYNHFLTITNARMINANEVPEVYPVRFGDKVKLSIRGVVGLSDLILRIIITIDAEISCSEFGRSYLISEWKNRSKKNTMKSDKDERIKQLARFIHKLGFPISNNIPELHDYFENEGLLII